MTAPSPQDEFYVNRSVLGEFVSGINGIVSRAASPIEAVAALRIPFSRLLTDRRWLPNEFRQPNPQGKMGGGIGSWLLYRSADRSLTLFSLVVPAGSSTPVHDHLCWGVVGLYEGTQEERVYREVRAIDDRHRELELVTVRQLRVGDFYNLLPPENDIHSVTTTSAIPSISLHVLANDIGCIWRHSFDPDRGTVAPFRSGYSNAECEEG